MNESNVFIKGLCGVYRFQMTYHNLTHSQSGAVWRRLNTRRRKRYYLHAKKCEYIYTMEEGIEIFFRTRKSRILHIDVVVFPKIVLLKQETPFIMFSSKPALFILEERMNKAITRELGADYTVDKFQLTEIECGVDITIPERVSTDYYLSLIRRSIKLTERDNVVVVKKCENGKYKKNTHAFRVENDRLVFTAHDRHLGSEFGYNFSCNMPNSRVRLRIGLNNKAINQAVKSIRLCGVMNVLSFFIDQSETIISDFGSKYFMLGKHYPYTLMKQAIDESGLPSELQLKMQLCLDYFHLHSDYIGINTKLEELLTKKSRREVISAFEEIDMNPIPIDDQLDVIIPGVFMMLTS